jgi:hypothetical protein
MLRVTCACGKGLTTDEKYAGRRTKCPKCGGEVTFPATEDVEVLVPTPQTQARATAAGIMARLEGLEASNARMKSWCRWSLGGATLALVCTGISLASSSRRPAPPPPPARPAIVDRPAPEPPQPPIAKLPEKTTVRPDAIFAKAFVLQDDDGKVKGIFGVKNGFVSLDMITAKDEGGLRIALAPDGTAAISMADGRLGENGSGVVMTRSHDGGSTFAIANSQNRVYSILVEPNKNPQVNATGDE